MKLDRLLAITMALLNKKRVSASELAERFEVSLRTIYRDMETINQAGIPVTSFAGSDGGYELMEGYRLEKQLLTLEDFASIVTALRGFHSLTDQQDIPGLLEKIGALHPLQLQQAGTFGMELDLASSSDDREKIAPLHTAIKESRLVTFDYMDYYGAETVRTIEPMGLYFRHYVWYLWGYCLIRSDFRVFRLSRIGGLTVKPETFLRKKMGLQDLVRSGPDCPPQYTIYLHFQPTVKTRVREEFPSHSITAQPDGSLRVTGLYYSVERAMSHILSYGSHATVVGPLERREEFRSEIQKLAQRYETQKYEAIREG